MSPSLPRIGSLGKQQAAGGRWKSRLPTPSHQHQAATPAGGWLSVSAPWEDVGEVSWCDPNPSDRSAPDRWPAQCGIRRASQPALEHRAHQENRAQSTEPPGCLVFLIMEIKPEPRRGHAAGEGKPSLKRRVGSSRDPESRRRVETPPSPRDRERAAPTWRTTTHVHPMSSPHDAQPGTATGY